MYTRCPHCETVFRVTPQQLQASSGQVRCGRCREVFDAFSTLSAQLPLGTTAPDTPFSTTPTSGREDSDAEDASLNMGPAYSATSPTFAYGTPVGAEPSPAAQRKVQSDDDDRSTDAPIDVRAADTAASSPAAEVGAAKLIDTQAGRSGTGEQDGSTRDLARGRGVPRGTKADPPALLAAEDDLTLPDELFAGSTSRRGQQAWAVANFALFALALAQLAWAFATPVANTLPMLRDPLETFCRWSGCHLALPRLPDQLFIEASDLQVVDASRPYEVVLTATIRNRAGLAQAFPLLELTLTGAASQTTARRVFVPEEYLGRAIDPARGIGANQEIMVRLYLNTSGVQASGYRLYLFFV